MIGATILQEGHHEAVQRVMKLVREEAEESIWLSNSYELRMLKGGKGQKCQERWSRAIGYAYGGLNRLTYRICGSWLGLVSLWRRLLWMKLGAI